MCKNAFIAIILCSLLSPIAYSKEQAGAVASAHPLATAAGMEILEKGGNAFDAAIAIASTLNVVEPAMSGLGGYGNTLIYDAKTRKIRYLNSSGKFPLDANADLMRLPTIDYLKNRNGAKSVSTPGNLNAWQEMHKKYGKLPWNILFDSAIHHADKGFAISPLIAKIIDIYYDAFSPYAKSFYSKNGHPLKAGDILIQKDLANTYRLIAKKGAFPFYQGKIAKLIDRQMKKEQGFLSLKDLNADVAEWWEPMHITHKEYEIYTIGVPGSGFTTLYALGVMEQFPLKTLGHNSGEYLHILSEVLKNSSRLRLQVAGNPKEKNLILDKILTKKNFTAAAKSIQPDKAAMDDVKSYKTGNNTTHFVVIDKEGNMVSSTQTLGNGFGSKVMIEGTGIWMNSAMAFATFMPKGNPMDVFPGKYKLSDNAPVIIMKNGLPWAALGTPGGHTIIQNTAQIIINLLDFNMNMQQAIDAPKLVYIEDKQTLFAEPGIPASLIDSLRNMGHEISTRPELMGINGKVGNAMGIIINNRDISFDIGIDKRRMN